MWNRGIRTHWTRAQRNRRPKVEEQKALGIRNRRSGTSLMRRTGRVQVHRPGPEGRWRPRPGVTDPGIPTKEDQYQEKNGKKDQI